MGGGFYGYGQSIRRLEVYEYKLLWMMLILLLQIFGFSDESVCDLDLRGYFFPIPFKLNLVFLDR